MAGRGVDIKLGEVSSTWAALRARTERHESRRIDNQLRGRSVASDSGETRFYLSGEDDLVRLFAGDRIKNIMERFKLPDDQPMEAKILSPDRERAEEGRGAELRRAEERPQVRRRDEHAAAGHLRGAAACSTGGSLRGRPGVGPRGRRGERVQRDDSESSEEVISRALVQQMQALYGTDITVEELREEVEPAARGADGGAVEDALERDEEKDEEYGPELMREIERYVILQVVDLRWRSHLDSMDYFFDGIHLRAMAQKDPLVGVPRRRPRDVRGARRHDPRGGRATPSTPRSR